MDAMHDQESEGKHILSTNIYGDPSLKDRPKNGLLHVIVEVSPYYYKSRHCAPPS
jgi:hypothetical protein